LDPFYESLFFSGIISYLMVFLLLLIRDLDNPFGYYEGASSADVTLQPIEDTVARLAKLALTAAGPKPAAKVAVVAPVAAPAPAPAPTAEPKSKKKGKSKRG
jgi:predicted membrane chloride channel (bestrophin family)